MEKYNSTDGYERSWQEKSRYLDWFESSKSTVVQILLDNVQTGTSFFINSSGRIMTCLHCVLTDNNVPTDDNIQVRRDGGGTDLFAHVVASNRDIDVAILQLDTFVTTPFMKLDHDYNYKESSYVHNISFPEGATTVNYSGGMIGSIYNMECKADVSINNGTTGSPILSTAGNTVGVLKKSPMAFAEVEGDLSAVTRLIVPFPKWGIATFVVISEVKWLTNEELREDAEIGKSTSLNDEVNATI